MTSHPPQGTQRQVKRPPILSQGVVVDAIGGTLCYTVGSVGFLSNIHYHAKAMALLFFLDGGRRLVNNIAAQTAQGIDAVTYEKGGLSPKRQPS